MAREWMDYQIKVIGDDSPDYPVTLKAVKDHPKKLFYRGEWDPNLFLKTISIVGSRAMSRYGAEVVENWMPEIVALGLTVISGFMYGVDTKAHQECLKCGGKTVAVLGSGLNRLTPASNDQLYLEILKNKGLVVSEYLPEGSASKITFPQRNRIVAALSTVGVLVIEAGEKSGSLITARRGRSYGKPVYALPGWVTSEVAKGTNWLIKSGRAKMATECGDFLPKSKIIRQPNLFDDKEEGTILAVITKEGVTIDEIANKLNLSIEEVASEVSELQLSGLVAEVAGRYYRHR